MSDITRLGTLDVTNFTIGAMLRAGIAMRRIVRDAQSLEEAADLVVRYLYDHCIDPTTGARSCALVRTTTCGVSRCSPPPATSPNGIRARRPGHIKPFPCRAPSSFVKRP